MPKAHVNQANLYYEVHGQGEPLVLIPGISHSSSIWFLQIPELSKHFKVVVYDNRGVGKSDMPEQPYSIADEADDVAVLLDELGLKRAHVLGMSRGGYIAQELAIGHPQRVRRLVLLATHYGGSQYREALALLWAEIMNVAGLTPAQIFARGIEYATTPEFFAREREMVAQLVSQRMNEPQTPHATQFQFFSADAFDSKERLHRISAQTLVIAGAQDRVVPLEFCEQLAKSIPNAQLTRIDGVAHLGFIERADVVNQAIISFLTKEG